MRPIFKRLLIIMALAFIVYIVHFYLSDLISLETIKQNKEALKLFVAQHYLFSLMMFFFIYAGSAMLALPTAALLSVTGGFLFEVAVGMLVSITAATIGAMIVFLIVRYAIGNYVQKTYKTQLTWLNRQLHNHGSSYLLAIRFMAVIPFSLTNLLTGLSPITFSTFTWTTFIGIIPGSFVFAFTGNQLNGIESIGDIFSPTILLAFALLGILALLPIVVQKIQRL